MTLNLAGSGTWGTLTYTSASATLNCTSLLTLTSATPTAGTSLTMGNVSVGTLTLAASTSATALTTVQVPYNQALTVTTALSASGSATWPAQLVSTVPGVYTTLNYTGSSLTLFNVHMMDLDATGSNTELVSWYGGSTRSLNCRAYHAVDLYQHAQLITTQG